MEWPKKWELNFGMAQKVIIKFWQGPILRTEFGYGVENTNYSEQEGKGYQMLFRPSPDHKAFQDILNVFW